MTACAMSLPAVPGLLAAESYREFWTGPPTPRSGSSSAGSRLTRFEQLATGGDHPWGDRAKALVGDLTADDLGLSDDTIAELGSVDHVVHCAAIYDITVAEDAQRAANVDGTRAVIALARRLGATLHHVSSIAVAGTYRGEYTEEDFDVAQDLPTPYHQTKFEAELLVRSEPGLRYRVYRPAVVVGDSRTGEMDKVDGPYYFFPILAKLAMLPSFTPVLLPDTGRSNIVPVDYVVDALTELIHVPDRDGQTFHLTAPDSIGLRGIYRGISQGGGIAAAARFAAAGCGDAVPSSDRSRKGAAQYGGDAAGDTRRDPRRRRPDADLHRRQHAGSVAGQRDNGSGVLVVRTEAVAVLGRAPRSRPGAARRPGRPAGRQARHHHRRVQRHRPGFGDRGGRTRCDGFRAGPQCRSARRPDRRDPRGRRSRRTRSPATSPTARRWNTRSRTSSAGSATSTISSTTRAARSAGRSRPRPTGCTTTNG